MQFCVIVYKMYYVKLTFVCNFLMFVDAYNILGIFPHHARSHLTVFLPLMKGLAKKGHIVTVISYFPLKQSYGNYTDIDLSDGKFVELSLNWENIGRTKWAQFGFPLHLINQAKQNCQNGLNSKNLRNFLRTKQKFDVIVIEMFNSDCFLSLVDKFPAPVVGFTSSVMLYWYYSRFGNPAHPAYIDNSLLAYTNQMTFFERVGNVVFSLGHQFTFNFIITKNDEEIVKQHFGEAFPPLSSISSNVSLMLVNAHFSYNLPRPLVPNVVEIGGIHIGNRKQLPKVGISITH